MTNEASIEILKELMYPPTRADGKSTTHLIANLAIETAIKALEQQKVGRWEVNGILEGKAVLWKCSSCGHIVFSEDEQDKVTFHKYCGACGARMEEENGTL